MIPAMTGTTHRPHRHRALAGTFGVLTVALGVVLWSLKRRVDGRIREAPDGPLEDLIPSIAGLSYGDLIGGNEVSLVQDGAFFDVLLRDIGAARHTVHFETFLWEGGVAAERVTRALCAKAREGVTVRVLVDGSGGIWLDRKTERRLKAAGCEFHRCRAGRWRSIGRHNNRDHRKIAVIDGIIGFIGGHCVTDNWLGHGQDKDHHRDITARIHGPLVRGLQSTFSENWMECTGILIPGTDVFPVWPEDALPGKVTGHIARMRPHGSPPAMRSVYHLAIAAAKRRLWLQNPYFLPDPGVIRLLADAVRRGVDVRVISPATAVSDMPMVQHAAHFRFDSLLRAGVRIFENHRTLTHQKVMTVDGVWCLVGSANFDERSFEINDEVVAGFADARLARELEEIFEKDLADCIECTLASWRERTRWERLRSAAFYLFREQL
jgi:cardiolipin synthase